MNNIAWITSKKTKAENEKCIGCKKPKDYGEIKSKIIQANLLISRVKDTLEGIKLKSASASSDEITVSDESKPNTADKTEPSTTKNLKSNVVDDENLYIADDGCVDCCEEAKQNRIQNIPNLGGKDDINDLEGLNQENPDEDLFRPKTRRGDSFEIPPDIEDKYRSTPKCRECCDGGDNKMDTLHAKLNTITELTDSDFSSSVTDKSLITTPEVQLPLSAPARMVNSSVVAKPSMNNASTSARILEQVSKSSNTESVIHNTQGIQVMPTTISQGTQNQCAVEEQMTQTFNELTAENTKPVEIVSKNLKAANNLHIQILPSVNIVGTRAPRNVYNYSIDSQGRTHLQYKDSSKNIGFVTVNGSKSSFVDNDGDKDLTYKRLLNKALYEEGYVSPSQLSDLSSEIDVNQNDIQQQSSKQQDLDSSMSKPTPSMKKSHSDSDILLNKQPKKRPITVSTSRGSDKEIILKSYHIYDNVNEHDPGILNTNSLDVVGTIDDAVYKTYINPKGFVPPPKYEVNTFSSTLIEPTNLGKLSSMRFLNEKPSEGSLTVGVSMSEAKSRKLWDIGLYATKSTQCDLPEETEFDEEIDKETYDKEDDKTDEIQHVEEKSFETISLTISYSTEESISIDSQLNVIDNPHVSHPIDPERSDVGHDTVEASPKYRKSVVLLAKDQNTLKNIREKMIKSHPAESKAGMKGSVLCNAMCEDSEHSSLNGPEVPGFISGLMNRESDTIKRVIPEIRQSLKGLSSRGVNNDFDVLPIQVYGDCNPQSLHLQDFTSPMKHGENGRYKDEENLFCEANYYRRTNITLQKHSLEPYKPKQPSYKVDSTNSDTVTTDISKSEGEIKCHCCVSYGEIHCCRKPQASRRAPQLHETRRNFKTVRKRRTYFNNWITYYINKNSASVNESSIATSSK